MFGSRPPADGVFSLTFSLQLRDGPEERVHAVRQAPRARFRLCGLADPDDSPMVPQTPLFAGCPAARQPVLFVRPC